VLQRKCCLTSQ